MAAARQNLTFDQTIDSVDTVPPPPPGKIKLNTHDNNVPPTARKIMVDSVDGPFDPSGQILRLPFNTLTLDDAIISDGYKQLTSPFSYVEPARAVTYKKKKKKKLLKLCTKIRICGIRRCTVVPGQVKKLRVTLDF